MLRNAKAENVKIILSVSGEGRRGSLEGASCMPSFVSVENYFDNSFRYSLKIILAAFKIFIECRDIDGRKINSYVLCISSEILAGKFWRENIDEIVTDR